MRTIGLTTCATWRRGVRKGSTWDQGKDPAWTYGMGVREPANYWARRIGLGWSNSRHANSVAAVQFRFAAGSCGPNTFASLVLFCIEVVQVKWHTNLRRLSVESPLEWFFGCTVPRWTARWHEWHAGAWSAFARHAVIYAI